MLKLQLPKAELEKFISLSSYIDLTSESITYAPITEYIKIEIKRGFCKMTLTSQYSFVSYTFSTQEADCVFFLSYTKLEKFFKEKRRETLTITQTESKTTLSDSVFSSSYPANLELNFDTFPKQPLIAGLKLQKIERQFIEYLIISKKYVMPEAKDKLVPILNLVSIKNVNNGGLMLSSDRHISSLFNTTPFIPTELMFFSLKEIDLVSNFEFFDYIKTFSWNIIKYKTILFGRRYNEDIVAGQMHEQILKYTEYLEKTYFLRINADQFFSFCKAVKNDAKDDTVNSRLEVISDSELSLTYFDKANNVELHQKIDCVSNGYEIGYSILFVHSKIIKVLDSLKDSTVNLSECNVNGNKGYIGFWLDSDANYVSICSKGFEQKSETEIQENSQNDKISS